MSRNSLFARLFPTGFASVFAVLFTAACHTPQTGDSSDQKTTHDNKNLVELKAAPVKPAEPVQTAAPIELEQAAAEPAKEEAASEPEEPAPDNPVEKPIATAEPEEKPAAGGGSEAKPESAPVAARVTLSGCLQNTRRRGSAELDKKPTVGPAVDKVRIEKMESGISVFHDLTHNCCFEADVHTTVKGTSVLIVEKLGGKVCRCMCNSTIRTDIVLETKKTYTVRVDVNDNGQDRKAHQERVSL